MKPDYKNWIPTGMIRSLYTLTAILMALMLVSFLAFDGTLSLVLGIILAFAVIISAKSLQWCTMAYSAFSYDGKRQLSRAVVEGTASYVTVPEGDMVLDVGCGSGALTIAVAKRNPHSSVIGIDRWGREYASCSRSLSQRNAEAEGVKNAFFRNGDANHLDFPDETFDAVTSNYVYHNITGRNRQTLLLETLRVLKKGWHIRHS